MMRCHLFGIGLSFCLCAGAFAAPQLTPRASAVAVFRTEGKVTGAGDLATPAGGTCTLEYPVGGKAPAVVLDFGPAGVGGYAVFTVSAMNGTPVVRLAYATHPDGICPTGDFTRETRAAYMGLSTELPVLPANLNRHELYVVRHTGKYIAPLVQGLTRYVLVTLDTPGTSVTIDSFAMANPDVFNNEPARGSFRCSDDRWNRLWAASVRTIQLSSFPNADAWKTIDGFLLPRKLTTSGEIGLTRQPVEPADGTVETRFEFDANPHAPESFGLFCRAKDERNGLAVMLDQPNLLALSYFADGRENLIHTRELGEPLQAGRNYGLAVVLQGNRVTVKLDGRTVDEAFVPPAAGGRVGFRTPKESWPVVDSIRVKDAAGTLVFQDEFEAGLDGWEFARTLPYLADGAKRDRLIWSGDLYWAERNCFYAYANDRFLRGSLQMLAFNQTPEGYVEACPYAENVVPPASGDYGTFQSDEFAAWLIPVAADYLLYTGDRATLRGIWPAIEKLLGYLDRSMGPDGLFRQRYETSKFAYSPYLGLGVTDSRAYMNILVWACRRDAAFLAETLGQPDVAKRLRVAADALKDRINAAFWDDAGGCFRESRENKAFSGQANSFALSIGFASDAQAKRIEPSLKVVWDPMKFQSLVSRGKFEYGYAAAGFRALTDCPNWLKLVSPDWKGLALTPESLFLNRKGWGDEAHPDTAIAGILSSYILGVVPTEPGFARFVFKPRLLNGAIAWAEGAVPIPNGGMIQAAWHLDGRALTLSLTVPAGTIADIGLPPCVSLTLDGAKVSELKALGTGKHAIAAVLQGK